MSSLDFIHEFNSCIWLFNCVFSRLNLFSQSFLTCEHACWFSCFNLSISFFNFSISNWSLFLSLIYLFSSWAFNFSVKFLFSDSNWFFNLFSCCSNSCFKRKLCSFLICSSRLEKSIDCFMLKSIWSPFFASDNNSIVFLSMILKFVIFPILIYFLILIRFY